MNWVMLTDINQLKNLTEASYQKPQIIYKHSTRCGISSMVLRRFEKSAVQGNADFYFLDLIKQRNISNLVAGQFKIHHESPQVLLIKNGECVYDESHYSITIDDLISQLPPS